ncbi:MAG: DUF624 domain-containing protein [Lachnospiraceae bacterium]
MENGGIFNLDSKFMVSLNKFGDLFWLNILTVIFCIPIITIGPAIIAMNNVVLKIYRGEESYIIRDFWKSFKENFRQGIVIGILYTAVGLFLAYDVYLVYMNAVTFGRIFAVLLAFVVVFYMISYTWVFVLQSRYENKIRQTMKNSVLIGISRFIQTIAMAVINLIPLIALGMYSLAIPICLCLGFTVPAFINALMYSPILDKIEGVTKEDRAVADDGWSVELEEENEENSIQNDESNS